MISKWPPYDLFNLRRWPWYVHWKDFRTIGLWTTWQMLVLHLLSNPNSWRLIHFNTLWFTITVAEIEFRKKNNFEILSNFFSGFCGPSGQNSPGQDILKYKYFPLNFFETILSRFDRKSNPMSIWLFPISCHFDSRSQCEIGSPQRRFTVQRRLLLRNSISGAV